MSARSRFVLAALLALGAVLPAGTSLADDTCRRPCQFLVPQKGEADPTAYGCHDLIENLSGTCAISYWDLRSEGDVDITVQSTPRVNVTQHQGNRKRLWIELG